MSECWPSDKWELPSENKYEVDLIEWWGKPTSELDHPMRVITKAAQYRHKKWESNNLYNVEAAEVSDFIIELVHEIERLETENIKLQLEVRNLKIWSGIEISEQQPFHMEPEK